MMPRLSKTMLQFTFAVHDDLLFSASGGGTIRVWPWGPGAADGEERGNLCMLPKQMQQFAPGHGASYRCPPAQDSSRTLAVLLCSPVLQPVKSSCKQAGAAVPPGSPLEHDEFHASMQLSGSCKIADTKEQHLKPRFFQFAPSPAGGPAVLSRPPPDLLFCYRLFPGTSVRLALPSPCLED